MSSLPDISLLFFVGLSVVDIVIKSIFCAFMLFVLRFMWTKLMHFSDITKYFEDKTGQRTKRGGSAMQNYEYEAVRCVKEKNGTVSLCKNKKWDGSAV